MRSVHAAVPEFVCTLCGKGCTRSSNLEMHTRTCTGATVASVSSTPAHRGGAASCSSTPAHRGGAAFTVQRKPKALGGAVEVHSVDMNAANQLAALDDPGLAPWQLTIVDIEHTSFKWRWMSCSTKLWTTL